VFASWCLRWLVACGGYWCGDVGWGVLMWAGLCWHTLGCAAMGCANVQKTSMPGIASASQSHRKHMTHAEVDFPSSIALCALRKQVQQKGRSKKRRGTNRNLV